MEPAIAKIKQWLLEIVKRLRWQFMIATFGYMLVLVVWLMVQNQRLIVEKEVLKVTVVVTQVATRVVTPTTISAPTLTPTPIYTSTLTPTSAPSTGLPPVVSGITPAATVQGTGNPFPIKIIGQNFGSGVTARLGANIPITVTSNTTTTVTGVLSPDAPVGVYTLTVTNPDDQSTTLSPVFIMRVPSSTLNSAILVVFGSDAQ